FCLFNTTLTLATIYQFCLDSSFRRFLLRRPVILGEQKTNCQAPFDARLTLGARLTRPTSTGVQVASVGPVTSLLRYSRVPSSRPLCGGFDLPLVFIDPRLREPIELV